MADHEAGSVKRGEASVLFRALWASLGDILGDAATATLLRRSLKQAAAHAPALAGIAIRRERFEYRFELPPSWEQGDASSMEGLRALVRELCPLLAELTGPVVLARLRQNPELRASELFPEEDVR